MPWCPKCKNEYREGITVCTDCGVALVDESELSDRVSLIFGSEDQMEDIKGFLTSNGIKDVVVKYIEEDDVYDLSVLDKDQLKAERMVRTFLLKVLADAEAQAPAEEGEEAPAQAPARRRNDTPYQSKSSRVAENRSTAYTFLVIGIVGVLFTVLSHFGIIPFGFGDQIIMELVAVALSIIFIFIGFVSFRNASKLAEGAKDEEKLTADILSWAKETLKADAIDKTLEDCDSESLYFKRYEAVKQLVAEKFADLDEEYLDHLIDEEIFDAVFPEED